VLTSAAARIPPLLQLSSSIGSFRARVGGWRQAFFAVSLFVVAFSIVGMHQLSLDHELAAPTPPTASTAAAHQHSGPRDHVGADHVMGSESPSLDQFFAPQVLMALDPADVSSGGHEKGCAGCGGHTMAFGACLLAFTLLVLSWWLAPPTVRLLPPRLLARPSALIPPGHRRVPALSLAELSILRT
jgi:hypothetical protein